MAAPWIEHDGSGMPVSPETRVHIQLGRETREEAEAATGAEKVDSVLDLEWRGKLIIMACSGTKRPDAQPMPAIERYDGPMWQTLRARLAEHPQAAKDYASGDLRIWVMSARYGFIDTITQIPDYNERLSPELAAKMARDPSYDFQHIQHMVDDASAVLFAGGETYRNAMWKASGANLWNIMKISETNGAGIGHHRAQIGAWFAENYAAQSERIAA
jgi:hypothetical protein